MRLSDLVPGDEAIIREYVVNEEIHFRLREMGLIRGTTVRLKRFAPFGDPMELLVRGFYLSLRKKDAQGILVEKISR